MMIPTYSICLFVSFPVLRCILSLSVGLVDFLSICLYLCWISMEDLRVIVHKYIHPYVRTKCKESYKNPLRLKSLILVRIMRLKIYFAIFIKKNPVYTADLLELNSKVFRTYTVG